eukprot:7155601-Prymnesium_polylepis.1
MVTIQTAQHVHHGTAKHFRTPRNGGKGAFRPSWRTSHPLGINSSYNHIDWVAHNKQDWNAELLKRTGNTRAKSCHQRGCRNAISAETCAAAVARVLLLKGAHINVLPLHRVFCHRSMEHEQLLSRQIAAEECREECSKGAILHVRGKAPMTRLLPDHVAGRVPEEA